MSILQFQANNPGQSGVNPSIVYIDTNDTLAAVTTTGYLSGLLRQGEPLSDKSMALVTTKATPNAAASSVYWLEVQVVDGVASLVVAVPAGSATVTLPTVSGDIAVFSNTAGNIADGVAASTLMLNNAANAMTSAGTVVFTKSNGTEATNALATAGVAGLITTSALTTAGGSSYAITWTNSFITATSVVLLTIAGGTNTTENITLKVVPGASTSTLTIYNNTASTALDGTIFISYLVM